MIRGPSVAPRETFGRVRAMLAAMECSVREAMLEDADAIARVHVEGWRWGYRDVFPAAFLDGLSIAARAARWREILGRDAPRERTWLAIDGDGGCVGFASIGPARDEPADVGELYAIYVAERVAGRVVGRALMHRAMAALREDPCPSAILWVLEANPRARRFYEREGWTWDGGSKREQLGGIEVVELRYRLALEREPTEACR